KLVADCRNNSGWLPRATRKDGDFRIGALRQRKINARVSHVSHVFKEMGYVTDPCVYLPLTQSPDSKVAILARSAREPSTVIPAIRDKFSHLDGSLPPLDL